MDETPDASIGLLTRRSIIDQLVHVAAVNGLSADDVSSLDHADWLELARRALGLSQVGSTGWDVELDVVKQLRALERDILEST